MERTHQSSIISRLNNFFAPMSGKLVWTAWILLLLTLPITSLPILAELVGGATVNPAAAIPLAVLVLFWLIPYFIRRSTLPVDTIPLLGFIAVAAISSISAYFLYISPWKGQTILSRGFSAWLTLGTGVAFYLVTVTLVDTEKKVVRTLQLLNIGVLVMLLWAITQGGVVLLREGVYPEVMQKVHALFSIRDMMSTKVSGLAYESSWLAHQLNILYFPLWLGIISQAQSIYKRRLGRVPFEVLILLVGICVLMLAKSRIGLVSFLALIGLLVMGFVFLLTRRIGRKISQGLSVRPVWLRRLVSVCIMAVLQLLALSLFLCLALIFVYLASKLDARLERLFIAAWPNLIPFKPTQIMAHVRGLVTVQFANFLMFAARAVYWQAAFRVFNRNPLLGVGLGNAGFFFLKNMPAFAWSLPEVVNVIRDSTLLFPNPKNLWLRLLAETGIVGFTFFTAWLLFILTRSLQLLTDKQTLFRALGLAGVLSMAAIVIEGFSLDTFGLPYMWVLLGLISAAARISRLTRSPA